MPALTSERAIAAVRGDKQMAGVVTGTKRGSSRRGLIAGGALAAAGAVLAEGRGAVAASAATSDPMVPVPMPAQMPVREGIAQLPGTRLGYWDTGGDGAPIILLHPATGSALIWGYQQPVFAAAGYRVIAYSRRGYHGSDPVSERDPGAASEDLHQLVEFLGIRRFHAVGSAAGCSLANDYALSHPERLFSMVLASGIGGVRDPSYLALSEGLRPKGFAEMPPEFREIGPSYRAANPEGVRQWLALEHKAITGNHLGQKPANEITWARLEQMRAPTLLLTGDADLWSPPAVMRLFARHIPNNELVVVPEAGHSVYWEQPAVFNRAVLDFIGRNSK
jgi:pimeloyl-ACP methyl ester carboxylesterase